MTHEAPTEPLTHPEAQETEVSPIVGGEPAPAVEGEPALPASLEKPEESKKISETVEQLRKTLEETKQKEAEEEAAAREAKGKETSSPGKKEEGKKEVKPVPPAGKGSGFMSKLWGWTKNISFGLFNGLLKGGILSAVLAKEMFFSSDQKGEKKK